MKQFQSIKQSASNIGIDIKIAKKGDVGLGGIHVLSPNVESLQDALDVAERDGFSTIFIHDDETWNYPSS